MPKQYETYKKFYHVRAIEIKTAPSVGIGNSHTPIMENTVSKYSISHLYELVKTIALRDLGETKSDQGRQDARSSIEAADNLHRLVNVSISQIIRFVNQVFIFHDLSRIMMRN